MANILATGAGASAGLEDLFKRMMLEDQQKLHQEQFGEQKRSNLADEGFRERQLAETSNLRRATEASTQAYRDEQGLSRRRDDIRAGAVLRPPRTRVTPAEYRQETEAGLPKSLYKTIDLYGPDFEGPLPEGEDRNAIEFQGTAGQLSAEDRAEATRQNRENADEFKRLGLEIASERENRLKGYGPPVVIIGDPNSPGGTRVVPRGQVSAAGPQGAPGPMVGAQREKVDAYKQTLRMIEDLKGFTAKEYQAALGPIDTNISAKIRANVPHEIAGRKVPGIEGLAGGDRGEALRDKINRLRAQASFAEGGKQFTSTESDLINQYLALSSQQPEVAIRRLREFEHTARQTLAGLGVDDQNVVPDRNQPTPGAGNAGAPKPSAKDYIQKYGSKR